jgi:signal transduction histidine kinase
LKLQALLKARDELISMLCEHNERIEMLMNEQNKQLMQHEKLAAIGDMVGEFTHEINTPVGIAITALSHNLLEINSVKAHFDNNSLARDEFDEFLQVSLESTTIANNNLTRLVSLIRSFKRTTVDQCSDECEDFNVKECLSDVVISLTPRLKRTPHTLELECAEDIVIYSCPGVFAQIAINLINNSLLHAFDEQPEGKIKIAASVSEKDLILRFSDNGCGIPDGQKGKIFDKFFTTKRGQDGSGLGLHIVRSLVESTLEGSVSCYSVQDEGCEFEIIIPLDKLKDTSGVAHS